MANGLFDIYKENMLGVGTRVDLDADTIRTGLVDEADWNPDLASDEDFADISANGLLGASGNGTRTDGIALASKTQTNGTFNADDATVTSVTGDACEGILVYQDDGSADATSLLLVYFDTGVTGLPVTPNGGDIIIAWNASGIFAL